MNTHTKTYRTLLILIIIVVFLSGCISKNIGFLNTKSDLKILSRSVPLNEVITEASQVEVSTTSPPFRFSGASSTYRKSFSTPPVHRIFLTNIEDYTEHSYEEGGVNSFEYRLVPLNKEMETPRILTQLKKYQGIPFGLREFTTPSFRKSKKAAENLYGTKLAEDTRRYKRFITCISITSRIAEVDYENRVSYVGHILPNPISSNTPSREIYLQVPKSWENILKKNSTHSLLWVVMTVDVDNDGNPISLPSLAAMPIFLQQGFDGYVVHTIEFENNEGSAGALAPGYPSERILIQEPHVKIETIKKIVEIFEKRLDEDFAGSSLKAKRKTDIPLPPGRIEYQRQREKSMVLSSWAGPYYETSTYIFSWWNTGVLNPPYGEIQHLSLGGQVISGNAIYLKVDHSLMLAVGMNGQYSEPSLEQHQEYQKIIEEVITSALKKTAVDLGGEFKKGKVLIK